MTKPSLALFPSGYNTGEIYSQLPTDGTGDGTFVRNCPATRVNKDGLIKEETNNIPRLDYSDGSCPSLLLESQATQLYELTDIMSTQTKTTSASEYTVSFYGSGTITFTGTYTGSLVGVDDSTRVSLTFTSTAGSLISTVSGSVLKSQLELGSVATSYIPNTTTGQITRFKDEVTPLQVTPTIEGAIINGDYIQQYSTETPTYIHVGSTTSRIVKYDRQLTAQEISDKGLQEVTFMTDLRGVQTFTIRVSGTGTAYWGDGTSDTYNGSDIDLTHTFEKVNNVIAFVGTLTEIDIRTGNSEVTHDLASLPSGLTYYSNLGQNTTSGNIANLPSGLTSYNNRGQNTTSGDIANLPSGLTYYNNQGQNQVNQYTLGRVWSASVNYVEHRPAVGYGLTSTMVDNLLIDLDNSGMSSGTINLAGNNSPRTTASDVAVASLIGKGVSVTTN